MAGTTVTISTINSFTDSGQEFRLDCILNLNGAPDTGASASVANLFVQTEQVKTTSFPKSGFAVTTGGEVLVLDATNKVFKTASVTAFSDVKAPGTFWFKKA